MQQTNEEDNDWALEVLLIDGVVKSSQMIQFVNLDLELDREFRMQTEEIVTLKLEAAWRSSLTARGGTCQ